MRQETDPRLWIQRKRNSIKKTNYSKWNLGQKTPKKHRASRRDKGKHGSESHHRSARLAPQASPSRHGSPSPSPSTLAKSFEPQKTLQSDSEGGKKKKPAARDEKKGMASKVERFMDGRGQDPSVRYSGLNDPARIVISGTRRGSPLARSGPSVDWVNGWWPVNK